MRIIAAIFCLFLSLPAFAQEKLFDVTHFTLDNGMEVYLIPSKRAPVVTHMVWYKVGAADEPTGQSGIAHWLEHLMFKGTKTHEPGEFSRIVRRLGGTENAFTAQDYTAYFQTVSSEHLGKMMRMEADRMWGMMVPEDEALSELKVVFEERRQRLENNPNALLTTQMSAALYPFHPYATPIIGWTRDLDALTLDKAMAFYNQYYSPSNARLIISGDIDIETVKTLAKDIYGSIEARSTPPRSILHNKALPLDTQTLITMHDARVRQPVYIRFWPAPNWREDSAQSNALDIGFEILSGGADSPLYQALVAEQKIATSVSLNYDSNALGPAKITLAAYPAEGVTMEELESAINTFLTKTLSTEITQDQVDKAVSKLQDRTVFLQDSISGPAMILGRALASGMTLDEIVNWPESLNKVTAEAVTESLIQWLKPNANTVTGHLLPEETVQ